MKRPFAYYILILLLSLLSLNAFYGGGALILSPDGALLGMNTEWLTGSPFSTFLIPGILLFVSIGCAAAAALVGIVTRAEWKVAERFNILPDSHWSVSMSLFAGVIAVIWIGIQQFMTRYFILQPVISLTGISIVITSLLPSLRKYLYSNTK
jgi:uncharacterized membrane protein